jgi:uncharacterized protein (TIGR00369 family)
MSAIASLNGLAQMQALAANQASASGMGRLMGMDGAEAGEGWMLFHAIPDDRHGNPIGITHGGFGATLLDSAMSCAVHTLLAAGETYVTTDLHVSFVKAITPATGRVTARGEVISRGRRLATARGTLTDTSGRVLATGVATCMIMASPQ